MPNLEPHSRDLCDVFFRIRWHYTRGVKMMITRGARTTITPHLRPQLSFHTHKYQLEMEAPHLMALLASEIILACYDTALGALRSRVLAAQENWARARRHLRFVKWRRDTCPDDLYTQYTQTVTEARTMRNIYY